MTPKQNKTRVRQHPFAIPIAPEVKAGLTVCPPPSVAEVCHFRANSAGGEVTVRLAPYTDNRELLRRYADMAAQKRRMIVRIDEELDVFEHPGTAEHYRMMIRDISSRADLTVIMDAARHLGLVSKYDITYDVREGLREEFEQSYISVAYTIGEKAIDSDGSLQRRVPIFIPYDQRRNCWRGLFEAMGYATRWGDCVLNVKRR